MHPVIAAALLLLTAAAPVPPSLIGTARVIDGDTLEMGRHRVRLLGMDAPESKQTCQRDDQPWPCGDEAKAALRDLVAGRGIRCDMVAGRDRNMRGVAVCKAGDMDLAREMVWQGMAVTYYPDSIAPPALGPSYAREEFKAKAAQRGLWSGEFIWPEDWRAGMREGFVNPSPAGPWMIGTLAVLGASGEGLAGEPVEQPVEQLQAREVPGPYRFGGWCYRAAPLRSISPGIAS